MEGHQPQTTDKSNKSADPNVVADNVSGTADIVSAPEDSEHPKEQKDVNGDEAGAKDDHAKAESVTPDGGHEDSTTLQDEVASTDFGLGDAVKKKKKRKPKSQRVAKAGTGFEEYYVDAPLKPEEHEIEKGLYHASISFAQRIETAIQRYVAKRNIDVTRKSIFEKYLAHGGIDSGPKMFSGGIDSQTIETSNAKDIAMLTATNFLDFDKVDPRNGLYVVDFEGCLKSFLSYTVPTYCDLETEEDVKSIVNLIRNFLNYLLHHNVCPEYTEQINASKRLCDQGERELCAIFQNSLDLPGTFNKACSELYGGLYQGQWNTVSTLPEDEEGGEEFSNGVSPDLAIQVFKLGIVANTSTEQFKKYEAQISAKGISITSVYDVSMEVVETTPSNEEVKNLYASRGEIRPVGKLKTKTWHTPFAQAEDLTEEEEIALANTPKKVEFYEFWVEDEILLNCFPGVKLEVTVTELSIGVLYFDRVHGIYCSFYDVSANAQMIDWREPEGEGNWLPMRVTGGGPLEDENGEAGLDGEEADKTVPEDSANGTETTGESAEETKKGSEETENA